MRALPTSSLAWTAALGTLLVWAGVGYLIFLISATETAHREGVRVAEEARVQQAAAIRFRSVIRETKEAREKLDATASVDVVEMLDAIEAVARFAKIPLKINQALSAPVADPASRLHGAAFAIEAEGTFTEVVHVVSLLETLSTPSFITDVQFEQASADISGSKASRWRVITQVHFLTTADISS